MAIIFTGRRPADIRSFIACLAAEPERPDLANPYQGGIQRHNLGCYLQQMLAVRPRYLLVGEAPGYRGAGLTGVPFVSEQILVGGVRGVRLLGPGCGYEVAGDGRALRREATATMVWRAIRRYKRLPLLWNALPFHPHQPGQRESNRAPRLAELGLGMRYLPDLLALFPPLSLIAVGRRAQTALTRAGYPHAAIRHPSHGGKAEFSAGLSHHLAREE